MDGVLEAARLGLTRLLPAEAFGATLGGALLVDTRTPVQRSEQGELPGALVIDRTVLEWRLDPTSAYRIPEATSFDVHVIVVCRQGYSSSVAAASLQAGRPASSDRRRRWCRSLGGRRPVDAPRRR